VTELTIIRGIPPPGHLRGQPHHARLVVPRTTLAKRRWRGIAEDGKEFGFDLDQALTHGSHFFTDGPKQYVAEQEPEEVLEIPITTADQAARIAWSLGNLHFAVQILPEAIRVMEDSAILQLLARDGSAFKKVTCVFLPLSAVSHHHHDHG
jgi:urease accessory protein